MACRCVSTHRITKNIELITQETSTETNNCNNQSSTVSEERPLLVLLCWLLAKRKHVMKYANFYLEQGFDVATVSVTPWQLMWPAKGTRVSILKIKKYYKILIIKLILFLKNIVKKKDLIETFNFRKSLQNY